ncbi:MAG: dipeptide epimerase [Prochlorothrix sp.]|nr:dipeptide epimerase [Prochlorothrix sp.]
MELHCAPFTVNKHFALTISRGTTAQSTNLWVRLQHEDWEGWGEASTFSIGSHSQTHDQLQTALTTLAPRLQAHSPWQRQALETLLQPFPSGVRTALDLALWDWWGKRLGLPLWQLWGLTPGPLPPTSVTIGIGTPAQGVARLEDWRSRTPASWVKVKLGSPAGAEADRALFTAIQQAAPAGTQFLVDANGGWDLETAQDLGNWLADRGIIYLEQPLPKGAEDQITALKKTCPLPIFLDESCWDSRDVIRAAQWGADGVNLKLMKTGGLTEAKRMVDLARTLDLQVMLGCYSDSSLLNTAAAQLAPYAQYLDLDSHLNLRDDPFVGVTLDGEGRLVLPDRPGLGVLCGNADTDPIC